MERLQRKFASIHSALAQQGAPKRSAPSSPRIAAKMGPTAPPRGQAPTAVPVVPPLAAEAKVGCLGGPAWGRMLCPGLRSAAVALLPPAALSVHEPHSKLPACLVADARGAQGKPLAALEKAKSADAAKTGAVTVAAK